jgi:hypothetical protein
VQPSVTLIIFLFGEFYEKHRRINCFILLPLDTGNVNQLAIFFLGRGSLWYFCQQHFKYNYSFIEKTKIYFPILLLLHHSSTVEVCKTYVLMILTLASERMGYVPHYYIGDRNTCNFISFLRTLCETFYRL